MRWRLSHRSSGHLHSSLRQAEQGRVSAAEPGEGADPRAEDHRHHGPLRRGAGDARGPVWAGGAVHGGCGGRGGGPRAGCCKDGV